MPRKGAHELIRPNEWGAKVYLFRLAGIQQTAVSKNPVIPGRDSAIFGAGGCAGAGHRVFSASLHQHPVVLVNLGRVDKS